MLKTLFIIFIFTSILNASSASIIKMEKDCDFIILKDNMYNTIVQWISKDNIDKSHIFIGDFYKKGIINVYNINSHKEIPIWIESHSKSENNINKKYDELCNPSYF